MDTANYRLGAVVSGSFSTVFARPIWFLLLPALLMTIPTLAFAVVGVAGSMIFNLLWAPFVIAIITGAVLGHVRGDRQLSGAALSNIGRSTFAIVLVNLMYTALIFAIAWLLFVMIKPVPMEMVRSFWDAFIALAQSSGDPDQVLAAMNVLSVPNAEQTVALLIYIMIFGFLSLVLMFVLLIFFGPLTGIIVAEQLGLRAIGRCIAMTRGYRGVLLGTSIVLFLIYIGIAMAISLVSGILTAPMISLGLDYFWISLVSGVLMGPVVGWLYVAFAHLYVELRRALGRDDELYLSTFR